MMKKALGRSGATPQELKALNERLKDAKKAIDALRTTKSQGFFDLPYDDIGAKRIEKIAKGIRRSFDRLIVIGIGGSDLGARTIIQALDAGKGTEVIFLSNPDPEALERFRHMPRAWWKKTAVNVVSKSGGTLETMSIFMFIREQLMRAVGDKKHASAIFVTTDPKDGILFRVATEHGYTIIPHPLNVGGRFSVLSNVGLFPAACAGIRIDRLLKGARDIEAEHRRKGAQSPSAQFAAHHYLAYKKRGQQIHVLMPYASRLGSFADWYRQIWAESLGKKRGKAHVGPTPVASLGSIDQHSQIQLYNEGPNDKVLTFIVPKHYRSKTRVPSMWKKIEGINYIGGTRFEDIMHAEHQGTAKALAKHERPNGTIYIDRISEESLGALFQFYEIATAYMGQLFGIDAYNQPGVEEGKQQAKSILMKN